MPNLLDLCIHGCILCPAVNTPMGDKCLQLGLTIGVWRRILSACQGQIGAGDVARSCFPVQAVVYLLTWVRGHVWALRMGDGIALTSNPPSPHRTGRCVCVGVCVCGCVNEWVITLDIYINQFIKSPDVQQSNVHNWHVQSLSASSGDVISFHLARVLQGSTYWTLKIMLTAGDVKALDGLCHMLSGSTF